MAIPVRPFSREQAWLMPPTLDDPVPEDHPVRFAAAFVDGLDAETWEELEIDLQGDPRGASAYHPRALLSVWIHGFTTGVRSCRKLEAACRDQVPYMWLAGMQKPDHNTGAGLWPAQRVARRRALPAQRPQPRSVGIAPAGHRVQPQEPPRGVEVWGQPKVALWGRSAAPTDALPERRNPPSPAPSPPLSPFCSCHPPSGCVPHPTHHAPYQSNETASKGEEVCRSALTIHHTLPYPCQPGGGEILGGVPLPSRGERYWV